MIKLTPQRLKFVESATEKFGDGAVLSRSQINEFVKSTGISNPSWFKRPKYRVGAAQYKLPALRDIEKVSRDIKVSKPVPTPAPVVAEPVAQEAVMSLVATNMETQNLVPSPFEGFVPWGHFATIKKIVESKMFYPVFVTGLSGNGKTLMIEQIHAKLKKELIRVNITIETDEDDLLGGFRLINGETKFVPGPVIEAMERGCTLLLDECDLGSNKLLALQPVLEGKGVFLKSDCQH